MSLQVGIPVFLVCTLLQATVLPPLRVFGGQPDLIVVTVLAWAILDEGLEGLVWAFVGGLFLGLFSGVPLGISALALLPIAYVVSRTEAQLYRTNIVLPVLLTTGGALAYHAIYMILLRFLAGLPLVWSEAFWYVTLPSVAFDVVFIVPALRLLGRLHDRLHPRRVRI
jgi:rod shape-determining protein MreD